MTTVTRPDIGFAQLIEGLPVAAMRAEQKRVDRYVRNKVVMPARRGVYLDGGFQMGRM